MSRVLLPSDHRDWVVNFASGYKQLGWDVFTGAFNFDLESCTPDVIHFNWPEELTGWRVPNRDQIDAVIKRLDRWSKKARIILSVNNLYPHGQHGDLNWHRLYTAFYERAEVIHHFSKASKDAVCSEYPSIAARNHLVRVGFNYELMLPDHPRDRSVSRQKHGFGNEDIVFLVFGTLRFWEEACQVREAFSATHLPGIKLLLAARYDEPGSSARIRIRRLKWRIWQRKKWITPVNSYVPDSEVYHLFDAADAIVVVRHNSLSSGVPSLAMTFGRPVIAPNAGGIPEYFQGSENLLYEPKSALSLAAALEKMATLDREAIGKKNAVIASEWGWSGIVQACLDALP